MARIEESLRSRMARGLSALSGGRVAAHQARTDKRGRIHIAAADRTARGLFDDAGLARLEGIERRDLGVHLVAEHPGMAGVQAAVFVLLESQGLGGHARGSAG